EINIGCEMVGNKEKDLLKLNKNNSYCRISVKDNGIGFDQKYATQIFEIFQRLHSKQEYAGTGIGLSLAKKIADNHGGNISAVSEENKGAVFNVILPIARNEN
ncbi:MAG: hybrid sensor histidine kinase/response regulator, partial [Ferruginibacter sp.]|nr:hybrid sensor histidine kinase/response regulator [Ferruginibacter sp.]